MKKPIIDVTYPEAKLLLFPMLLNGRVEETA
jgi:hypothetical protein